MPRNKDEAIKEAYATGYNQPANIIIQTLTFTKATESVRYTNCGTDDGNTQETIDGVERTSAITAITELGETEIYNNLPFTITGVHNLKDGAWRFTITIPAPVTALQPIIKNLATDAAIIDATYRSYLKSDLTQPAETIYAVIQSITSEANQTQLTCGNKYNTNQNFPYGIYNPTDYPGLRT